MNRRKSNIFKKNDILNKFSKKSNALNNTHGQGQGQSQIDINSIMRENRGPINNNS